MKNDYDVQLFKNYMMSCVGGMCRMMLPEEVDKQIEDLKNKIQRTEDMTERYGLEMLLECYQVARDSYSSTPEYCMQLIIAELTAGNVKDNISLKTLCTKYGSASKMTEEEVKVLNTYPGFQEYEETENMSLVDRLKDFITTPTMNNVAIAYNAFAEYADDLLVKQATVSKGQPAHRNSEFEEVVRAYTPYDTVEFAKLNTFILGKFTLAYKRARSKENPTKDESEFISWIEKLAACSQTFDKDRMRKALLSASKLCGNMLLPIHDATGKKFV